MTPALGHPPLKLQLMSHWLLQLLLMLQKELEVSRHRLQ
jgi:hypothetical protein